MPLRTEETFLFCPYWPGMAISSPAVILRSKLLDLFGNFSPNPMHKTLNSSDVEGVRELLPFGRVLLS